MSGGGLNLPNPEELDAPAEGETAAGTLDPSIAEALGAILGNTQQPTEQKASRRDYLGQLFGGSIVSSGASDSTRMSGLGSRRGSSMTEVVGQIATMTDAELSYLQRRLFQAGFYDGSVYTNGANISWGMADQATVRAIQTAFDAAGATGVDNFDSFLASEAARFRRDGVAADGSDVGAKVKGEDRERPVVDILLEDPDAIRLTAEAVGTELLGRKPTEQELGRITAKIHAEQTRKAQEQARAYELAGGGADSDPLAGTVDLLGAEMDIPGGYTAEGDVRLTAEQFENAKTIIAVGQEMGLSEQYIVGALSAAIVESGLRNVNYGDRDSVGLFQQRTSQGWGTVEQILDPRYSSRKFYEAMLRADGDTLGERVANTQRPAKQYRGRYAEQMNKAAGVLSTILGSPTTPPGQAGVVGQAGRKINAEDAIQTKASRPQQRQGTVIGSGRDELRHVQRTGPSSVTSPSGPVPRAPEEADTPFWLDSMVGNSESDPIFNTVMGVDVNASIAEEMRRMDPVAYQTRQAAMKAYEFFSMLGAGGGLV